MTRFDRHATRERFQRLLGDDPELPTIYITDTLSRATAELLDSFAQRRPSEGVVYWYGIELGDGAVVTTLIVPDADTRTGAVQTSEEANAEVVLWTTGTPLVLLGQAHSHPGSNVVHSPTDDRETFARFDGALSVVVPFFGRYGLDLGHCGVYRHIDGAFRCIPASEHSRHLVVLPGMADFRPPLAPAPPSDPRNAQ